MSSTLRGQAVADRLDALTAFLGRGRSLWRSNPFRDPHPGWQAEHPALAAWLEGLTPEAVAQAEQRPSAVDGPAPWPELVREAAALTALGRLPVSAWLPDRGPAAKGVKARKWDQVRGFLGACDLPAAEAAGPVVEWCAGRGHLGRTLAVHLGRPAVLLEREPGLCAPPHGLSERPGVRHACVDVLGPDVHAAVPEGASLVGLHACGRLGDRLAEVAQDRGAAMIALAPCCAHRRFGVPHAPRSARGAVAGWMLDEDDLRLATLDEVVATPRRAAQRRRQLRVRVAVDLLARRHSGREVYHGGRSVPRDTWDLPFADAVRRVAEAGAVRIPDAFDADALEEEAAARALRVRALALVRLVHRRPLELWLALDRACELLEAGWDVEVGTFCPREASPRDLLILARAPRGGGRRTA
ncbi:MAG: methyltransferase [Alphaproteobacteria bacterium]|nr:methyltransferase [Alphaproteobacteria bacterium]